VTLDCAKPLTELALGDKDEAAPASFATKAGVAASRPVGERGRDRTRQGRALST
jgi:hypothetical protein